MFCVVRCYMVWTVNFPFVVFVVLLRGDWLWADVVCGAMFCCRVAKGGGRREAVGNVKQRRVGQTKSSIGGELVM